MALAKQVILCVIDGMRPDGLQQAATPHLDQLIAQGSICWQATTVTPSVSLPCHTSMFRAVLPDRHGIRDNTWRPRLPLVPSVFDVTHRSGLGTAAFYSWEPLRDLSDPGALDAVYYRRLQEPPLEDDLMIARAAASYLVAYRPAFSFVYFGATDAVGHQHGWMSAPYLAAIGRADQALGQLLTTLEGAGLLAETAFLVLADHGGHDHDHAAGLPEDITIPWLLSGPGVRPGYRIVSPVSVLDTAPTLLHLLGLAAPAEWQGRPVLEAFL